MACTTRGAKLSYEAVAVDGGAQSSDAVGEATLDIEELAALAPSAHIIEYQGTTGGISFGQGLTDVFNTIAQENRVAVVSVSYGDAEGNFSNADFKAVDQQLANLAAEGVTVAIASGDCAAFASNTFGVPALQFPSSDPLALAVGGTILQVNGQGHRSSEVVWSNPQPDKSDCFDNAAGRWGTGGGLSQVWKQPSWQTGKGVKNKYSDGARQVPDVGGIAFDAAILFQGQFVEFEGTSIAAPVWAAGIALVDEGLIKNRNEVLGPPQIFYDLANKAASQHPYYDVTRGNNFYYAATSGWDYDTGWGCPNLLNIGNAVGAFSK